LQFFGLHPFHLRSAQKCVPDKAEPGRTDRFLAVAGATARANVGPHWRWLVVQVWRLGFCGLPVCLANAPTPEPNYPYTAPSPAPARAVAPFGIDRAFVVREKSSGVAPANYQRRLPEPCSGWAKLASAGHGFSFCTQQSSHSALGSSGTASDPLQCNFCGPKHKRA